MPTFDVPDLPSHFRRMLGQCRELYVNSSQEIAREHPQLLGKQGELFVQQMDALHRNLLIKLFVTLCDADAGWSKNEQFLAEVLIFHLQGQWLTGDLLSNAIKKLSTEAQSITWGDVLKPFDQIPLLRNRISELETLSVRIAHLIARADGPMKPAELETVQKITQEIQSQLQSDPRVASNSHEVADKQGQATIAEVLLKNYFPSSQKPAGQQPTPTPTAINPIPEETTSRSTKQQDSPQQPAAQTIPPLEKPLETAAELSPAQQLAAAMAELDRLIGLENIKEEVHTLANFLEVQQQRQAADLPIPKLSLHMVFGGNPGTGKTTVARIVGKIFGAMGVLKKGHLIETDRSGLVAEYSGQTGPKTNKKIDEAMDGVLFIDEAYTLSAADGQDTFGSEAIQTLLKRMEDDRKRLVVILAGYPHEMKTLLRSNPGLSSRFSRQLEFIDYLPVELAKIFGLMCNNNRYQLLPATRAKVMLGFQWLYQHRDRHFGNGRTSRNLFENAIRRMANRVAGVADLSLEQLSVLEADDIEFKQVPPPWFAPLNHKQLLIQIDCPECKESQEVVMSQLGSQIECSSCNHTFGADWGEIPAASLAPEATPTDP